MTQLRVRMHARDSTEAHRAATPLELFFDLVFVVAIAQASGGLHHGVVEGHAEDAVISYLLAFFGIWWAWMNLTWFASAYDTDDVPYRLAVFVIMAGVLILAAGIPRAFDDQDFGVMTLGYVVMRLAMVALWLRAAWAVVEGRRCALRYAAGIFVLQILWVLRLALPDDLALGGFVVLALGELVVPVWAEAAGRTNWHPAHMAERYALFTIIVLGESVLAATVGAQSALDASSTLGELLAVITGGLLIVFSMWWIYFDMPTDRIVNDVRAAFSAHLGGAFTWGYGHYVVFASAAATGAGLAVAVDHATGHSDLSDTAAGLAVTLPVSIYLLAVWGIHAPYKPQSITRTWAAPIAVALILASTFSPEPVLATGVLLSVLVGLAVVAQSQELVQHRNQ